MPEPVTLGDHVELMTGFPFKSANYSQDDSDTRLVRGDNVVQGALRWDNAARWPKELTEEVNQYQLQAGDVVLAMDRPWIEAGLKFAKISVEDLPSLLVQRVARLRAKGELDQSFLFYLIGSRAFTDHVLAVQTGTAVPHISGKQVLSFEFNLPSLHDQRAIAEVLGSLDDKIEQNRRTGRALEGLARGVFKAWFVDFEPVKAKAAGATAFPGMPPETFAALPTRIFDSDLGPVPQGWKVAAIGDALTLSKQQINPQDHADEMFDHYSIPAFDAGQNAVVEPGGGIKSQKFVVVPGCVLLSKLNPRIARVWLPPAANERRQIASTEFLVAVPRPGWTREFLFCLFLQDEFRDSLAQSASGTSNSHQRVRPGDLLTRPLVVPSTAMREAFADQVVPQIQLRAALHFESAKLATLRDYLLPRLLSGRVRVRGEIT